MANRRGGGNGGRFTAEGAEVAEGAPNGGFETRPYDGSRALLDEEWRREVGNLNGNVAFTLTPALSHDGKGGYAKVS